MRNGHLQGGEQTPGLRRHPSRHLRAGALRLEIKLATAMENQEEKRREGRQVDKAIPADHEYTAAYSANETG